MRIYVILGIVMTNQHTPDFYLVYYPRSAGRYFMYNYEQMTMTSGVFSHNVKVMKNSNVISIIRNPQDSISSTIIAGLVLKNNKEQALSILKDLVDKQFDEYTKTYSSIIRLKPVIVKYEDVVNDFNSVVKKVAPILGHKVVCDFKNMTHPSSSQYLATSKLDDSYDDVYRVVSQHKLMGVCNEFYADALDIAI